MKSSIQRVLPRSKFVRGVSVLVGGTASAQILLVLASPILTRLYSPEDFGLLAVYAGLLSIISAISGLRYELAIPLPESDQDAANIVMLSIFFVLLISALTGMAVLLAGDTIAIALGVPMLADVFWLLPLGIFLQGIYKIYNYWAIRVKKFTTIARTKITQSVAMLVIQLLGFNGGGVTLMAGHAIGQGAGGVTLLRSAMARPELLQWRWSEIRRLGVRYKKFPVFSTWGALLNTAGQQLPPILFAAAFSASAAGIYTLAHRVLAIPISVLGQAVANVFFSNAAQAQREGRLDVLVNTVHAKLAQLAMPPVFALMIVGPEAFALVFGQEWRTAGDYARWMAPWLYLVFVTSPLSTLFEVLEKQNHGMVFQALLATARVAAITVGVWAGDVMVAVALFTVSSATCWLGFLSWIALSTGNRFTMILKPSCEMLVISIVVTAPLWWWLQSSFLGLQWWLSLIACATFCCIHYWRFIKKVYQ